jgi:hypothetical protein
MPNASASVGVLTSTGSGGRPRVNALRPANSGQWGAASASRSWDKVGPGSPAAVAATVQRPFDQNSLQDRIEPLCFVPPSRWPRSSSKRVQRSRPAGGMPGVAVW